VLGASKRRCGQNNGNTTVSGRVDLGHWVPSLEEGAMTDHSSPKNENDDDLVEVVFIGPRRQKTNDPYDLGELFLAWAWGSGYRDWNAAVGVLARALRGLAEAGLIERRTIRRVSGPTHHGFVLTEDGHEVLRALSGDWIADTRSPRND
jgi:hypothetical protein